MDNDIIKDKYTKVCICRSISRNTIKEAIRGGARSLGDITRKTGAITGNCKGTRCSDKIRDLLKTYKLDWE